ncbi:Flap endonuclease 1 [Aphelenchoides bicaudatus]|nr:Flap endonuclease 1 [Aphelenchoides bicaudatus]
MSRGAYKKSDTGVRAIAGVLGISRQEVSSFTRLDRDPPPLYPPIGRQVLPVNESPDLVSMIEIKEQLLNRSHLSQFYQQKRGPKEITRYTDKFRTQKPKDLFEPDFSRLPAELNWKGQAAGKRAKIRKLNETTIEERIAKLEKNADKIDKDFDPDETKNNEKNESDTEQKANNGESDLSDEDLDEVNDYIDTYFDNGEGGGESDDNLDDGNLFVMGIKDLSKVIGDHAPNAIRQDDIKAFFGRTVAVDASMSLYQFLIAVRQDGAQLMNAKGETTSHLNGMFYRSIRMMENGIKPVYVFDGKPPSMKSGELEKRTERRAEAQKELEDAIEKGDAEAAKKYERRLVKVTKEQNEQCKRLLRAMGIPVVDAPEEAESQCAELVRKKKVYGAATEDMDALTFGSNVLLRHLTFSEAKKMPIKEYSLERILKGFDMTMEQFIDMCILLGCDYCSTIKGIGPKKAFELISKHKTIENILENLDTEKFPVPEGWNFVGARKLFLEPEVTDGSKFDFVWGEPNEEELIKIMVEENSFSEERIRTGIERLKKTRQVSQQGRIDSFFKPTGIVSTQATAAKRKLEEDKKAKEAKGKGKKKARYTKK